MNLFYLIKFLNLNFHLINDLNKKKERLILRKTTLNFIQCYLYNRYVFYYTLKNRKVITYLKNRPFTS